MRQTGKTNCRVNERAVASTYELTQPYSLKSTVRQGVKAAKSIDAPGKSGFSYRCQAAFSIGWAGFWMVE